MSSVSNWSGWTYVVVMVVLWMVVLWMVVLWMVLLWMVVAMCGSLVMCLLNTRAIGIGIGIGIGIVVDTVSIFLVNGCIILGSDFI